MNNYRIDLSDRQRSKNVQANEAKDAIAKACGKRYYSANHECDGTTQHGTLAFSRYQVIVTRGPVHDNGTPVTRIWATVYKT